jgi:hypothetical protein
MNGRANVLAVQSYGRITGPDDTSKGATGSKERLKFAKKLVEARIIPSEGLFAIFPQGYSGEDPTHPDQEHPISLGEMMATYLKSLGSTASIPIYHEPLGWSTAVDVVNTIKMVQAKGYTDANIHFVSDSDHIKRVEDVWKRVRPRGWTATFHGTKFYRMSWWERWLREPAARLYYWFKI